MPVSIIGYSTGFWAFSGIAVTQLVILCGMLLNARRVKQVNRAVNHQPEGSLTLVERVVRIEHETKAHRSWENQVFHLIAAELGVSLPSNPPKES
jgi:hypothetical protein